MNNAAISRGGGPRTERGAGPWTEREQWTRVMDVNFGGVLNGVQAFAPEMMARRTDAAIVNVGSKQGITNPPATPPTRCRRPR